ncbi:MAG TPA: DUF1593 domain-containing protein [Gemmatimonadaceae bacterium]
MMPFRRCAATLLVVTLCGCTAGLPQARGAGAALQKPRVIVTADPELDDSNSLVRYLLHSTDFRTEGIVYASSGYHWKGDGSGKKWSVANREYNRLGLNLCPCESWRWARDERFIDDALDTYERVYPNLRVHDANYPTPAELKSKVRWGNVEFDGDISKDSPGSELIKGLLLDDAPGPLYLLAWGGQSTIARALKSIQEQYEGTGQWPAVRERVSRKAVLSASGDQDDTYATYIRPNWPDIQLLPSGAGGVPLGYGAGATASEENAIYYSADWTRENVSSRGPLGAFYRVWGDGKQMVKGDIFDYFGLSGYTAKELQARGYIVWTPPRPTGEFLGEGDTFTYLNLVDNGLLAYEAATPGGWAGHGVPNVAPLIPAPGSGQRSPVQSYADLLGVMQRVAAAPRPASPSPNFVPAVQNAFAARMQWSVTPTYAGANHEPRVAIRGSSRITARPGETIQLDGATSDPDGNSVSVKWWQWKDVDTYPGQISFSDPTSLRTSVQLPADAVPGQTIHVILEASDDGAPPLTRYQRVVVSVAR